MAERIHEFSYSYMEVSSATDMRLQDDPYPERENYTHQEYMDFVLRDSAVEPFIPVSTPWLWS